MKKQPFVSDKEKAAMLVQKAIDHIQQAKDLMDEVMATYFLNSRIPNEYYAYGQFGIQQALGEGNPYDGSLIQIRDNILAEED